MNILHVNLAPPPVTQRASVFLHQQNEEAVSLCFTCFTNYGTQVVNEYAACVVVVVVFRHKHGGRTEALQTQSGLQAAAVGCLQVRISASPVVEIHLGL